MKKIITALFIVLAMCAAISLSACSSSEKTVDQSIKFGDDGNVYMPQKLCDAKDPDVSPEMKQKLNDWWAALGTDKNPNGKVICTK